MKLLQINATYGIGSTGRIVKAIHEQAIERGIHSYVACQHSACNGETYMIGNRIDHKVHAFLCRINGRQACFSKNSTQKLLRYMDSINPDIVHLHNLHNNYINLNMLLDYVIKKEITLVLTLHDCWFFTGKCFHYTMDKCDRWKQGCGSCPKRKSDTPTYFRDFSGKTFIEKKRRFEKIKKLYVVGVSQWIANEARHSLLSKADIRYCYNGVDLDVFKMTNQSIRQHLGLKRTNFVILGMANKWRLDQNKEAVSTVCRLLDENIKLVLIGVDNTMNFDENIVCVPMVRDSEKMTQWYSMADVFINLTWEDTLPFVNIEALACGTPVITHKTSGATETIDEETGVLVDPGDVNGLIKAIKTVKMNGKKYYQDKCIRRVRLMFDAQNVYDSYFKIYGEVKDEL